MQLSKIRIGIIEDDANFRNYLKSEVEKMTSCDLDYAVDSLNSLKSAEISNSYNPHIVLLDMYLGEGKPDGLRVIEYLLKKRKNSPKILIISTHCTEWMVDMMRQRGDVNGCVKKSVLATAEYTFLEGLINNLHKENEFVSILDYNPSLSLLIPKVKLTSIQYQILNHLNKGKSQKQIAFQMDKPQDTIGNHVAKLRKKFGVMTTFQLLNRVKEQGLL